MNIKDFNIGDKIIIKNTLNEEDTGIPQSELNTMYNNPLQISNILVEENTLCIKSNNGIYEWNFDINDIEKVIKKENNMKLRGFEFIGKKQAEKDIKRKLDNEFNDLKLPKRGTSKSAGYDIFAPFDITLQPNEEIKVPTFLKAYMQDGEVLLAFPRSGLGFKYYCRLANTIGVVDGDYYNNEDNEGHIFVKIRNEGNKTMTIKKGDGMCQMIFMPFLLVDGDSFDNGDTRKGGFGSTTK